MKIAANDPSDYEQGQRDYKSRITYKPGQSSEYKKGWYDQYWSDLRENINKRGGLR